MANDAIRRIMAEVREFSKLNQKPNKFFYAYPLESDLFEWHFTVRGPPDTAFEQGVYHGRIVLPPEYPLKAPEIIMLTPNGRFEVGQRICLSVTSHHQESWQPSWGIRTILTALVGFMPSKAEGVGALDYPDQDRRMLARKSHSFVCQLCGAKPTLQLPPLQNRLGSASDNPSDDTVDKGKKLDNTPPGSSEQHASGKESNVDGDEKVKKNNNQQTDQQRNEVNLVEQNRSNDTTPVVPHRPQQRQQNQSQEKELLFIAYAIVGLMIAVIIRRMFKTVLF